jgi:ABC-type maltose transport system permease subunit
MKNKLIVSEKAQSITTYVLWLIILSVVAFTLLNPTKSKAENLNAIEVKEMPKNPALKKYHKMQKRMEKNVFKPYKRKRK